MPWNLVFHENYESLCVLIRHRLGQKKNEQHAMRMYCNCEPVSSSLDTCESPKILAGVSYCMSLSGETPIKNVSGCDDTQPTLQQNKILSLDSKPLNLLPWQRRWSLSCIKAEASDACSAKAKYKHTLTGGSRTAMRGWWGQQLLGYLCCKVLSSERKTWERFPGFTWCPWATVGFSGRD